MLFKLGLALFKRGGEKIGLPVVIDVFVALRGQRSSLATLYGQHF